MLEWPEVSNMSAQLHRAVVGKTVECVYPPSKLHKLTWFSGDPTDYHDQLAGQTVVGAEACGMYVDLVFDNGYFLSLNDGVNIRFLAASETQKDYQLCIAFTDGTKLVFTVGMYGGILLRNAIGDDSYYLKSRDAVSPFSPDFSKRYYQRLSEAKETISAKAFLATEQRFPGVGNGVCQDILFAARIHPKRKLKTLDDADRAQLLECMVSVLSEMTNMGGRNTEKDLYGCAGGYVTKMSKHGLAVGCPVCGGAITKEAYMGGSVYYCPHCQK